MKNSSYYIAPVGDRTHDLPQAVASNMVKVSHALNHSAMVWPTIQLHGRQIHDYVVSITLVHSIRFNTATCVAAFLWMLCAY